MSQSRFEQILISITKKTEECVDCSGMGLTDEQADLLVAAIETSSSVIKSINLSNNDISDKGAVALAKYLKSHLVNEIYLAENHITEVGAQAFLNVYGEKGDHPSVFDLRENQCSEHYITRLHFLAKSQDFPESLKQALLQKKAKHVTFEGLKYINLDTRLVRYVFQEVEGLESVDFSYTSCGDAGILGIGTALKDSKLKSLVARGCAIGNTGLLNFIESSDLPHHQFLEQLDLSENMNITDESGSKIANLVFNTNMVLLKLDLSGTTVSSRVCAAVASECELNAQPSAVKNAVVSLRTGSPSAREVNLQWEKNTAQCIQFLWQQIRDSSIIEVLNVSNTAINDDDVLLLCQALERNRSLRVLELANNKITAKGVTALFSEIQRGVCAVEEVNVANNNLSDDSTSAIIQCLRTNAALKIVNVDVNPNISQDHANEIGGLALINRAPPGLRSLLPKIEWDAKDLTAVDLSNRDSSYNDEAIRLVCRALMLNTCVRRIDFSHNIIGDIGAVYIAELLASNTTIVEANLSSNSIGNRGANKICEALLLNKALKKLNMNNNVFGEQGVEGFPKMLRANHFLREVTFEKTRVSEDTTKQVHRACDLNREPPELKDVFYRLQDGDESLIEIDLSENKRQHALDDASLETLCFVLRGSSSVKKLILRGNAFGTEGCKLLAGLLTNENCQLTHLDISRNSVDDFGFVPLIKTFEVNKSLSELDVRQTAITDTGFQLAVPEMRKNSSLKHIAIDESLSGPGVDGVHRQLFINSQSPALKEIINQLDCNETVESIDLHDEKNPVFEDGACQLLCKALLKNTHILSLDLSGNKITTKSVPFLTEVIEECPHLVCVDVSNNQIDNTGASVLLATVERVTHIRTLSVKGNAISADTEERIAQVLTMNMSSPKLKEIVLQHSRGERLPEALDFNGKQTGYRLSDEEAIVLAHTIRNVTDVRALDLGNNKIGESGCVALAEVLRANHSLEALYLDQNPEIGTAGGEALFYALRINPQLHTLNLENTKIPKTLVEDIDSLLHVNQTNVTERIDMRAVKLADVDDAVQFRSTDYYVAQQENIELEALGNCKRSEQLLLE